MGKASHRRSQQKESAAKLYRRDLGQTFRLDPRYLEDEAVHSSLILRRLKASYADRGDTFGWAVIVWSASIISLSPFLGTVAAAALSIFITLAWAGVHRVRHI